MSRYLLLLILCLPFIVLGVTAAVVNYKLGKSSKKRLIAQISMWLIILLGLALASPIYEYLLGNDLTVSEPLSLFDVVSLIAVVTLLYALIRTRAKLESIEDRTKQLHEELSIFTSMNKSLSLTTKNYLFHDNKVPTDNC